MLSAFGVGFFYRVILPGILVVALLAPMRPSGVLTWTGVTDLADTTAIVFLIIFAVGLVLSSARHIAYYAAEGFYWAPWTALLRRRLQRKLRRKHVELTALAQKRSDAKKLSEKEALRELHLYQFLADFHVSTKSGRPSYVIERPTRIGNVIAAYELYAQDRYGFDGVFWWFHVRFSAPAPVQMGN